MIRLYPAPIRIFRVSLSNLARRVSAIFTVRHRDTDPSVSGSIENSKGDYRPTDRPTERLAGSASLGCTFRRTQLHGARRHPESILHLRATEITMYTRTALRIRQRFRPVQNVRFRKIFIRFSRKSQERTFWKTVFITKMRSYRDFHYMRMRMCMCVASKKLNS